VIKRVAAVDGTAVRLTGDATGPFGTADRDDIIGRVVYRYAPSDRAGRLVR
jgi:hypothetical protein